MLNHKILYDALKRDLLNWGLQSDIIVGLMRWFSVESPSYVNRVVEWQGFLCGCTGAISCGPLLVRAKAAIIWGDGFAISEDVVAVAAVHQIAMLFWKEEASVPPDWDGYASRMASSGRVDKDHPILGKLAKQLKLVLGEAPKWDTLMPCAGSGATADGRSLRDRWYFNHRPLAMPASWYEFSPRDDTSYNTDVVTTARAAAVPKNRKSCRIVASEPCHCMAAQLALMGELDKRLGSFYSYRLPIHNADVHRRFLRAGHKRLCTIDLSDASDYISMELASIVFPSDWFDMFCACRSQAVRLPDMTVIPLATFAPMGNGFCFRTLSAICASIMAITCKHPWSDFGDDMIVHQEDFSSVCMALRACGLRINEAKTCTSRYLETCGLELLDGYDITPLKIKRLLTFKGRYADRVAAYNAAQRDLCNVSMVVCEMREFPHRINRRLQRIEYRVPKWVSVTSDVATDGWPGILRWQSQRGINYHNETAERVETRPGFGWVTDPSVAAAAEEAAALQNKFEPHAV